MDSDPEFNQMLDQLCKTFKEILQKKIESSDSLEDDKPSSSTSNLPEGSSDLDICELAQKIKDIESKIQPQLENEKNFTTSRTNNSQETSKIMVPDTCREEFDFEASKTNINFESDNKDLNKNEGNKTVIEKTKEPTDKKNVIEKFDKDNTSMKIQNNTEIEKDICINILEIDKRTELYNENKVVSSIKEKITVKEGHKETNKGKKSPSVELSNENKTPTITKSGENTEQLITKEKLASTLTVEKKTLAPTEKRGCSLIIEQEYEPLSKAKEVIPLAGQNESSVRAEQLKQSLGDKLSHEKLNELSIIRRQYTSTLNTKADKSSTRKKIDKSSMIKTSVDTKVQRDQTKEWNIEEQYEPSIGKDITYTDDETSNISRHWRGVCAEQNLTEKYDELMKEALKDYKDLNKYYFATSNYENFQPDLHPTIYYRSVEIYDFPYYFTQERLKEVFFPYSSQPNNKLFRVGKSLAVFVLSSPSAATAVLTRPWPFCEVRPLSEATQKSWDLVWLNIPQPQDVSRGPGSSSQRGKGRGRGRGKGRGRGRGRGSVPGEQEVAPPGLPQINENKDSNV